MNVLHDTYGPLIRLDARDLAGLTWVKVRARQWINGLKRRRRYGMPRGAAYTEQESQVIEALAGLEREVGRLLAMSEGVE